MEYQRLIAMGIIAEDNTIQHAANIIGVKYQAVHEWTKNANPDVLKY